VRRASGFICAIAIGALALAACGGASAPSPRTTLTGFVAAWSHGRWTTMRGLVLDPPASFVAANRRVFTALGVSGVTISAGRVTTTPSGDRASAPITERYALPQVGTWSVSSTVHLVKRRGDWKVRWSPATIDPKLTAGETVAVNRSWPTRGRILGAGGASLISSGSQIVVGLVGQRITSPARVRADLLAAGAPSAAITTALARAKANPTQFEPVFTISRARFAKLRAQTGPDNVYSVPGTQFEPSSQTSAITPQLAAHVVGSIGPITAQQLKALGSPYDASSTVGQTGLEASQERRLAGTPTTRIDAEDSGGNAIARLATFPGTPGRSVHTSIDPKVQRAAEAALSGASSTDVSMVAIKASTGQVLAVVSDPITTYNTAFEGAYPPGSTFKVLTSSMLFQHGLTSSSPASCPPTITVDGETFHNAEGDAPVSTITQAFTESCNTAFIGLAVHNLEAADYTAIARLYGLQRSAHLGLPAFMDNVPAPKSQTELAGDAIGQGNVTFSALGMATVAAAVDSGVVRAPRLVAGAPDDRVPTSRLPASLLAQLRPMMADVVTGGTAAGTGLPSGTYAKTGTAEYGSGPESTQKIDGWLMGYNRDIAFAIVTHDTGGQDGGPVNGPLIAKFLDALGD
jgi:cell division protein FtsI/penicillin-binding protein 2